MNYSYAMGVSDSIKELEQKGFKSKKQAKVTKCLFLKKKNKFGRNILLKTYNEVIGMNI